MAEQWTDELITHAIEQFHERVTELVLQVAALRAILEESGVSKEAVSARVAEFRKRHNEQVERGMAEWRQKQVEERLRRLFEEPQSTIQ